MELQRQAGALNGRADSARHARLVLLLADGLTWAQIPAKLDCGDRYIDRWSKRFADERLAGLFARYAGRAHYQVTDRIEARVLAWTTKHTPGDGSTHWSSRKLAAQLGDISHMTVPRIWAKYALKPHHLKGYLVSTDPEFEARTADVIGLYLHPPPYSASTRRPRFRRSIAKSRCCPCRRGVPNARALSTSVTAPSPCTPRSTPRRAGSSPIPRHISAEFVAFPTDLVTHRPTGKEIHVIADNLAAHKTARVEAFLAQHPKV